MTELNITKIDTEYSALTEIDESIRGYYAEDTRERVIGYEETGEEGESLPITEPYTVIVLNKPGAVTYQDVAQRRAERKPWDSVIKPELERAIAWEEFSVNHDGYLSWLEELTAWADEQPQIQDTDENGTLLFDDEGNPVLVIAPAPECPAVDVSNRREVYQQDAVSYDAALFVDTGERETTYDDENYIAVISPVLEAKPDEVVAAHYAKLAKDARDAAEFSVITVFGQPFQADQELSLVRIRDTADSMIRNKEVTGLNETTYWILEDNSMIEVDGSGLKAVMDAVSLRRRNLFSQYGSWLLTDKLKPFEPTGMSDDYTPPDCVPVAA